MSIFGNVFRRRSRTNHPDGSRSVVITDRFGNVRKTKQKGPAGTFKQRYDRDGQMWKAKQKGRGVKRLKQRYMRQMDPRIIGSINQQQLAQERNEEAMRRLQQQYSQLQTEMYLQQLENNMPAPMDLQLTPYTSPNTGMTIDPNWAYGPSGGPQTQMRRGGGKKKYYGGGAKKRYKKGGGKARGPHGIL
jgi:FtsZ-interacting cell division protein ZipA